MSGPYAAAAEDYRQSGWAPLPLPSRRKAPPPAGWTGYGAPVPSGADVHEWATNGQGDGNVGLRLPATVLGIDVDAYRDKPGGATLDAAEARLGPLPDTPVSTSRDDGVSGIRFYLVPAGRCWADVVGPGIEVIHHGHRYAVAAPSVHPEGRPYRWFGPDGQQMPAPVVDDLPVLPPAWVTDLDRGAVADRGTKGSLRAAAGGPAAGGSPATAVLVSVLGAASSGPACPYIARALTEALAALRGGASRHDTTNRYAAKLLRAGEQGHQGALDALVRLGDSFISAVSSDPHRPGSPVGEWKRSIEGAVRLVAAKPTPVADLGCCDPEDEDRKPTVAVRLVKMAEQRYRLGISTAGEPFAVSVDRPHLALLLRGGQGSLRAALADDYYAGTGQAASQQPLADALLVLEGKARRATPERLWLRTAETDGALWVDLGDAGGTVATITAAGWETRDTAPVLFQRTALTGALAIPEAGGDLDDLWLLLNVAAAHRPLLLAWLLAALKPDIPHPVLALNGEQGSGKSTASRILAALLDPSPAQTRKPPRDEDGWVTAAAGSWIVAVDNVSSLPSWLSDSLCRAVTGDGDVRRRLYSDADLTVFAFRRVVLLNGIDLGAVRDDLADRLVSVHLDRLDEQQRLLDADLAAAWATEHPRILGALLDLAARVVRRLPTVRLDAMPRMADYAKVLAAVDAELGTDGLAHYLGLRDSLAADAVAGDPVLSALGRVVLDEWVGTAADLLTRITPNDPTWRPGRDWPRNARGLTGVLRRRAPSLRQVGWVVEILDEQHPRQRAPLWRLVPPDTPGGFERSASESASEIVSLASHSQSHSQRNLSLTSDDVRVSDSASETSGEVPLPLSGSSRKREEGEERGRGGEG